jgi:hypothetical protein
MRFNLWGNAYQMTTDIPFFVGLVGVVIILWVYCLVIKGKISPERLAFSLLNVIGSIFILISLLHKMNVASFIIEIAWLLISLLGVISWCFKRRKLKSL